MSQDVLAQEIIQGLAEAVQRGGRSLGAVPGLLRRLIDENMWQRRNVDGELVMFNKKDFRAFVEAPYPVGISTTLETLEALCGHEPKIMDFIAQAKQGKPGGQIGNTNASKKHVDARGHVVETNNRNTISRLHPDTVEGKLNSLRKKAYTIDRATGEILGVKDERIRQLYEAAREGRISPNAAAIDAGVRRKSATVPLDTMENLARALKRRLSEDELRKLKDLI